MTQDDKQKKTSPPPHIPRGQVQQGQVQKGSIPRGTIKTGQIEIVAPPGSENVVRCPKCTTAMSWEPGQMKWYCQTCMIYYDP